jgi:hypothetical protein
MKLRALVLLGLGWLWGCSPNDGEAKTGTLSFTVWGEEFIEAGIPADVFADAWSVRFDSFLVVVGDARVGDHSGDEAGRLTGTSLLNLVQAGPHALGSLVVEARA